MQPISKILSGMPQEHASCEMPQDYAKWQAQQYNKTEGTLNEQDGYNCEICRNKGYVMLESGDLRECECMKMRSNIRRLKRSGLQHISGYTFRQFRTEQPWQKEMKDSAYDFCKNPQGWFFVGGQSGIGKSHLCTAICRHLMKRYNALYFMWRDEAAKLKTAVAHDYETYAQKMDEAKNIDVLYIDDLFKAGGNQITAGDINLAFEILNSRYVNNKITVISSEYRIMDINRIDEAVAGRIREKCGPLHALSISKDSTKNWRWKDND